MHKSRIVITCAKGIPPFLKEEVLSLGLPILSETVSGIETEGTMNDAMRLNLFIRTGQRILFLLEEFNAKNPDELYKKVSRIAWENYISKEGYLCITSSVDNTTIKDSRFANLKCKDAIVDRIYEKYGQRPDSGPKGIGPSSISSGKASDAVSFLIPQENPFPGAVTEGFLSKHPCRRHLRRLRFWLLLGRATGTSLIPCVVVGHWSSRQHGLLLVGLQVY